MALLWSLCPRGHPLTPENTYFIPSPWIQRRCKQCNADQKMTKFFLKLGPLRRKLWIKRQGKHRDIR